MRNRFSIIPLLAVLSMRKRESYRHTLRSCFTLYFWLRGTVIYLQNLTANLLASWSAFWLFYPYFSTLQLITFYNCSKMQNIPITAKRIAASERRQKWRSGTHSARKQLNAWSQCFRNPRHSQVCYTGFSDSPSTNLDVSCRIYCSNGIWIKATSWVSQNSK